MLQLLATPVSMLPISFGQPIFYVTTIGHTTFLHITILITELYKLQPNLLGTVSSDNGWSQNLPCYYYTLVTELCILKFLTSPDIILST